MKDFWIVIVVVILAYLFLGGKRSSGRASGRRSASAKSETTEAFLKAQWALAEQQRNTGAPPTVPSWFFDPVTDRQQTRLEGSEFNFRPRTKGQASDVIGLTEPVEDDDAELLKFFKVPLRGLNQTLGRYQVRALLADPVKKASWQNRAADPMQKEFMRFVGLRVPKGLTHDAAVAAQNAYMSEHGRDDDAQRRLDEWSEFECIVEELWDSDARKIYDIKRPTLGAIRAAVDALTAEGKNLSQLSANIDLVADKLRAMKPELAR